MMDKDFIAIDVARMLLEIEAVHLSPDAPFTLTSGAKARFMWIAVKLFLSQMCAEN